MYPFRAESPRIDHYRDYLALPRAMNLKKQSRTGSCIQFFLVPLNDQVLGTLCYCVTIQLLLYKIIPVLTQPQLNVIF